MNGNIGDRIVFDGAKLTQPARAGVIEEILGDSPARYLVRWDDGRTTIVTPSAGSGRIEPKKRRAARTRK
jgi:hypothetical protein